jgi:hypothetical protein
MNTNCAFHAAALTLLIACLPADAAQAETPVVQTLTQEMAEMDVVAFVKLIHIPPQDPNTEEPAKARFEVIGIVKGDTAIKIGQNLELNHPGKGKIGDSFSVNGFQRPRVEWSVPQPISPQAMNYVRKLTTLPKDGPDRLRFFLDYLEDEDEIPRGDAFDEFTSADYATIKALKPHLNHDKIVARIQDPEISASHRRLHLLMLGVCGNEKDAQLLESELRASDRKGRKALDAVIACYLSLQGESGITLIENLFLRSKDADYASTYSAIIALRFHGNEAGVLKRERVVQAMRLMLKRLDLADLAIPDLAAWEDWQVSEEVFELFKAAGPKKSWIRIPAINYLRLCPTPRAKEMLAECEKIDPEATKRARLFFPDVR